jgi:hypothetical protein
MKRAAEIMRVPALIMLITTIAFAQDSHRDWVQHQNIPPEVLQAFRTSGLDSTYEISFHLNPFYLRGDFNGDKSTDYAVLVQRKSNGKVGIAVVLGRSATITVCGAGYIVGGSDNFNWMDAWCVYTKGPTHQGATELPPPALKGDALLVKKLEAASGLIYWTGKRYEWYQQGD